MNKVAVIGIVGNTIFMSVDHFHNRGETLETTTAHYEFGAKGFNQALAAARFGAEVSFLAPVGDDYYEEILELCKKEKIKPYLIKKKIKTSFGCVLTDKKGENQVTVFKGANLQILDVKSFENEIKQADVLLLNNEINEEVNLAASKIASQCGVKIILNPAPYRKTSKELLDKIYLFTPNESEAKDLEKYPNVIKTMGEKGCYIKEKNLIVPSTEDVAVDTTGAGDTFNGVLAWGLANGKSIIESVDYAVKASGKSVTKKGAASSIPYLKEIIKENV